MMRSHLRLSPTRMRQSALVAAVVLSSEGLPVFAWAQAGPPAPGAASPAAGFAQPTTTPGSTYVPPTMGNSQQIGGFGNPQSRPTAPSAAATRQSRARTRSPETRKTTSTWVRTDTAPARRTATTTGRSSSGAPRSAARSRSPIWFGGATRSGASAVTTFRTRTNGRASGRTTRRSRTRSGFYPGDEVHLKRGDAVAGSLPPSPNSTFIDRRRQIPLDTVVLRDQGWIHDPNDEV